MRRIRSFVISSHWISNWATNRDCLCPPAERILEPDGCCFRCGGRVVQRTPFRADGWSRGG